MAHGGSPVSARAEAERRRAMALKALDQRVTSSSPHPSARTHNVPSNQAATAAASSRPPAEVVFTAPGDDDDALRETAAGLPPKGKISARTTPAQEAEAEWPESDEEEDGEDDDDDDGDTGDGDIGQSRRDNSKGKKVAS